MPDLQSSTVLTIGRQLERGNHWWRAAKLYEKYLRESSSPAAAVHLQLAKCRINTNRHDLAIPHLQVAIESGLDSFTTYELLGSSYSKTGNYAMAIEAFNEVLRISPDRTEVALELVDLHLTTKDSKTALRLLEDLYGAQPDNIEIADRLARVLKKAELRWRELEVLEANLSSKSDNSQWHRRIAEAALYLRKYDLAAKHFYEAFLNSPDAKPDTKLVYEAATAYAEAGDKNRSLKLFDKFLDTVKHDEKKFGIGAYHQKSGRWQLALDAYEEFEPELSDQAELYFLCGRTAEKLYAWKMAQEFYNLAVSADVSNDNWHYRLGYVCDRLGEYSLAAAAYTWSAKQGQSQKAFRWFRAGYSHSNAGNFAEACKSYIHSSIGYGLLPDDAIAYLSEDFGGIDVSSADLEYLESIYVASKAKQQPVSSRQLESLADAFLAAGDPHKAASLYSESEFHHTGNKHKLYAKHALSHFLMGKFEDASRYFQRTRAFPQPSGVDERPYLKGIQTRRSMIYNEFRTSENIAKQVILFESSHGSAIHCNPKAIYDRLKSDPTYKDYKFVWVLNDLNKAPREVRNDNRTVIVGQNSDEYLFHLATAEYLINNATFPTYFIRREDQKYLNTWHGTPLKLMGKRVMNSHFEHSNVVRNFLHSTHLFLPNEHTVNALLDDHDISGLVTAKVMVGGSPRVDRTITLSYDDRKAIRHRLGVYDDTKRIVLYAPTWRGRLGDQTFDNSDLVNTVSDLQSDGYELVFRAHRFAERAIAGSELGVNVAPADMDTNSLLAVVDVLITDYSSIFFDYLPTNRPVIFYTPDYEEYSADRGLYFDRSTWPGQVCDNRKELVHAVEESLAGFKNSQTGDFGEFIRHEDGNATSRAISFLFGHEQGISNGDGDSKIKILFYQGSFMPNGITTSFLNLISALDRKRYEAYVVVDPRQIKVGTEAHRLMLSVADRVKFIARTSLQVQSPEERYISDRFHRESGLGCEEQWNIFHASLRKEFLRTFGYSHFDHIIDFEGYSRFWASVLANPYHGCTPTSIYLHNDMVRERDSRFPRMQALFSLYYKYDKLISVSKSVHEENMARLADEFSIEKSKFDYADNLIDKHAPISLSETKHVSISDYIPNAKESDIVFVNMARLSPEKGQEKLVRAFAKVNELHPGTRLLIVGDGPLRHKLESLVSELGLSAVIAFTGQLSNPFPLIAAADCFVFSSEYEGQGLAMIESLILGTPVISTDVVGSRSVVENGYGLLVDNSQVALAEGMLKYLSGWQPEVLFDADDYFRNALDQFETRVLRVLK